MDSIFDLMFESGSVHDLLECQNSISKMNKTVSMASLIDLNHSENEIDSSHSNKRLQHAFEETLVFDTSGNFHS